MKTCSHCGKTQHSSQFHVNGIVCYTCKRPKTWACPMRVCPVCTKRKPADNFTLGKCRACTNIAKHLPKKRCVRCGRHRYTYHFTTHGRVCSLCRTPHTLRKCSSCGKRKPNNEFAAGYNGLGSSWCKACHNTTDRPTQA